MGKAHELQPISLALPVLVVAFHPLRVAGGWVLVGTRVSGEAKPRLKGWGIGVDAPPGASGARRAGGESPAFRPVNWWAPGHAGEATPRPLGLGIRAPASRVTGVFVSAEKPQAHAVAETPVTREAGALTSGTGWGAAERRGGVRAERPCPSRTGEACTLGSQPVGMGSVAPAKRRGASRRLGSEAPALRRCIRSFFSCFITRV